MKIKLQLNKKNLSLIAKRFCLIKRTRFKKDLTLLFNVDKSRISRHIKNILDEGELDLSVAENATTGTDGKTYTTRYYNLDMIIAVGYRVNSKRGTLFRKCANSVLKQYLLNGYAINSDRILMKLENITKEMILK